MITDKYKSIIEILNKNMYFDAPKLNQNEFDNLVDYVLNNVEKQGSQKEILWRLCGCYEGLNFNKVIDLYIETRDSYYISELVSYLDGELDQKYLVDKMIKTNDFNFIKKALLNCGDAMKYSLDKDRFDELDNFINSRCSYEK